MSGILGPPGDPPEDLDRDDVPTADDLHERVHEEIDAQFRRLGVRLDVIYEQLCEARAANRVLKREVAELRADLAAHDAMTGGESR